MDPNSKLLVDRIVSMDLSKSEQSFLMRVLIDIADEAESLPPKYRQVVDRTLYRLVHLLPLSLTRPLVLRYLHDPRKARINIAYRAYKTNGVDPDVVDVLLEQYEQHGDKTMLWQIVKSPKALVQADAHYLLQHVGDRYWRMRVVEGVLNVDCEAGLAFAEDYPIEFVWAVSRLSDTAQLPVLRRLLLHNASNPEFVRWYIWALGKLGAREDLVATRAVAEPYLVEAERSFDAA